MSRKLNLENGTGMPGSWRDSCVRLTPEYIGGVFAGLGLGLAIGSFYGYGRYSELTLIGFLLIPIGVTIAMAAQKRARGAEQEPAVRDANS